MGCGVYVCVTVYVRAFRLPRSIARVWLACDGGRLCASSILCCHVNVSLGNGEWGAKQYVAVQISTGHSVGLRHICARVGEEIGK
jgi:hypothetical protein